MSVAARKSCCSCVSTNRRRFELTPETSTEIQVPCPQLCPDGTQDCWPTVTVRLLAVSIRAHSKDDATVTRGIESKVRLRNDLVTLHGAVYCPA